MSILDLRALLAELLNRYDPDMDTTAGSRADTEIIQPFLRRLGPDPFSLDVRAFLHDRLAAEFPDMSSADGDAITDLLIKPVELLMDPLVRERIQLGQQQSMQDPDLLTLDEAHALGANLFVAPKGAKSARGVGRLYFTSPQPISVTPANVVSSRTGLGFFPDGVQGSSAEEMLLRTEGSLFYMDVRLVAAEPGEQYNIDPAELVAVDGLPSVTKVTNKLRFRDGTQSEDAPTYVGRAAKSLTERSLVTLRGIMARLSDTFPELTRLNVVGRGDPEMQRDVLRGGSLGTALSAGSLARAIPDQRAKPKTRRIELLDAGVDLLSLVGPVGVPRQPVVLTVFGSFFGNPPMADLPISTILSATTLEVEEPLPLAVSGLTWSLRRKELRITSLPGGLSPVDTVTGAISVPADEVHVGGAYDVHVRGTTFESGSVVVTTLSDERPVVRGLLASSAGAGEVELTDLILAPFAGNTYDTLSDVYEALSEARRNNLLLEILDGAYAGTYPILSVAQPGDVSGHAVAQLLAPYPGSFTDSRWKIIDAIDQSLLEPRVTKITGKDLVTQQGSATITTEGTTNFNTYGVAANDTLRVLQGPLAGDYQILEVQGFPSYSVLLLDTTLQRTLAKLQYEIFRANPGGGVSLPLIRVTSIDLLDANKQATGAKVPYGRPVAAFSSSFSNPAQGIKLDVPRAVLGIVSDPLNPGGAPQANVSGKTLEIDFTTFSMSVTFAGANPISLASMVSQLDAAAGINGPVATIVDTNRLGIIPVSGPAYVVGSTDPAFSALPELFGDMLYVESGMVRSADLVGNSYLVEHVRPAFDRTYDVVQILDGSQTGSSTALFVAPYPGVTVPTCPAGLTPAVSLIARTAFSPEVGVHAQLGARSLGTMRVYFLDPTTFTVGPRTRCTVELSTGAVEFEPDPSLEYQLLPALPKGTRPKDGSASAAGTVLTSLSNEFLSGGIAAGDVVDVLYVPITGSVSLADPVPALADTQLLLNTGVGADIRITLVNDSTGIAATDVTRAGVVDQINRKVGKVVCKLTAANRLEFEPEVYFIVRKGGSANSILGFSTVADADNAAPYAGRYTVTALTETTLSVTPAFPASPGTSSRMQFVVKRPGMQRVGTSQMAAQKGPVGMYYADIELVSRGTGDVNNIAADTELALEGYECEGYELISVDTNTTFSPEEDLRIRFSPQIHEEGANDRPQSATTLYGQSVQVNYEHAPLVRAVQDFALSEEERVVCASPLGRHLIPHFVRTEIRYSGGPKTADAQRQIETIIHATFPESQLEVSDIVSELTRRGADSVINPVTLYALVHNVDRTVSMEKSADRINLGRLAAFIPDQITLLKGTT